MSAKILLVWQNLLVCQTTVDTLLTFLDFAIFCKIGRREGVPPKIGRLTIYGVEMTGIGWLVVLRLNVPVNNFSVMSGRSHRFLGN